VKPAAPEPKPVETPAPKVVVVHDTPHDKFSIYEERPDYETVEYGERELPKKLRDVASTHAPITWTDDKFAEFQQGQAR